MRILVTIAHYYKYKQDGIYGSESASAVSKIDALRKTILRLKQLFHSPQCYFKLTEGGEFKCCLWPGEKYDCSLHYYPANTQSQNQLDIIICTDGKHHVLTELGLPEHFYQHRTTDEDPKGLSFFCQDVLQENKGKYDYYCFMEDDLVIQDSEFFNKLIWFNQQFGHEYVLQPHRYEYLEEGMFLKGYIEPQMVKAALKRHTKGNLEQVLSAQYLSAPIRFVESLNPHSGCYFLTKEQFEQWASKPYFAKRTALFVSPLESGASLGIMKTFIVVNAEFARASFFEIEHGDARYVKKNIDGMYTMNRQAFYQAGYRFDKQ